MKAEEAQSGNRGGRRIRDHVADGYLRYVSYICVFRGEKEGVRLDRYCIFWLSMVSTECIAITYVLWHKMGWRQEEDDKKRRLFD